MNPKPRIWSVVELLARLVLGLLLLAAAIPKIRDPAAFLGALGAYRLLPELSVAVFAWFLPWLELCVAGALLCAPLRHRQGAWLLNGLLYVSFLAAHASAWARGLDIRCGCFGGDSPVGFASVLTRAGLAALTVLGAVAAHHQHRR
jgi:uncharacterized membrane protein YphA (DoxX/SURF4 family)